MGKRDDQFDLCEAALAIGLALFGVTALMKRWWMFAFALVPAAFGVFMGIMGFLSRDTASPIVKWMLDLLG